MQIVDGAVGVAAVALEFAYLVDKRSLAAALEFAYLVDERSLEIDSIVAPARHAESRIYLALSREESAQWCT